ncbi:hypothetical protein GTQ99_02380 [Kineococcus sp. T13]|uniref:hypothetical protein n=1 Tax=Kineococcus vitellinus TaxID=2696565 RepID=UPI0014122128|nr:hypothetical protein [Kineococcus vitellinus]NAZ74275.1 hypothetical protein [Kineococcus vitellinus]
MMNDSAAPMLQALTQIEQRLQEEWLAAGRALDARFQRAVLRAFDAYMSQVPQRQRDALASEADALTRSLAACGCPRCVRRLVSARPMAAAGA